MGIIDSWRTATDRRISEARKTAERALGARFALNLYHMGVPAFVRSFVQKWKMGRKIENSDGPDESMKLLLYAFVFLKTNSKRGDL